MSSLTFEELNVFLGEGNVINSTFAFVKKLIDECVIWNGYSPPSFQWDNPRIFLSLYFYVLHPKRVLSRQDAEIDALVQSAQKLCCLFTRITNVLLLEPCSAATIFKQRRVKQISKDFYDAFNDYMSKFIVWKEKDLKRMILDITDAIRDLFTAKLGLVGDKGREDPKDQPMINETDSDIKRLRLQLRKHGA